MELSKLLRAILSTIAAVTFSLECLAATLNGVVTSDTGEPLSGVQVSAGKYTTISDEHGSYSLESAAGLAQFELSFDHPAVFSMIHSIYLDDRKIQNSAVQVAPVALVKRKPGRVMLAFAGDTMMGRRYLSPLADEPVLIEPINQLEGMKQVLRFVRPYLTLADSASVNLETQLIDGPPPTALEKSVTFHTATAILEALEWAGVDYVALGNNHTYDFQEQGLNSTLDALNASAIGYSGAGVNEVNARRPFRLETTDAAIAYFSYVGWPGLFHPNQTASSLKGGAAEVSTDTVRNDLFELEEGVTAVVQVHTGLEYQEQPTLNQKTLFHQAIDFGADLVFGHHPHVIQGFDLHKGKLIGYSLGNFAFDQYIYSTQLSMMVFVWMDGSTFYRAEVVPLFLNSYIPMPAFGEIAYDIKQRILRLSNADRLQFSLSGSHVALKPGSEEPETDLFEPSNVSPGLVVHLSGTGTNPLQIFDQVGLVEQPVRLGVDLIKRGSFETYGDRQTIDRNWLMSSAIAIEGERNKSMRIQGSAVAGMRTFERAFKVDNPATIIADVNANDTAVLVFKIQRRDMEMSRTEALDSAPMEEIGRLEVNTVTTQISVDFDTPRTATKGIRLLIEVIQNGDSVVELDNIGLLEWSTPWLDSHDRIDDPTKIQATHVQMSAGHNFEL